MSRASVRRAVLGLFDALDRRDLRAFLASFAPGARIVHDDGRATTPAAFVRDLVRGGSPPPAARRLGPVAAAVEGAWAWAAYSNRPTFRLPGGPLTLRFAETAILREAAGRWRFVRVHYSGRRPA